MGEIVGEDEGGFGHGWSPPSILTPLIGQDMGTQDRDGCIGGGCSTLVVGRGFRFHGRLGGAIEQSSCSLSAFQTTLPPPPPSSSSPTHQLHPPVDSSALPF